ncbi:hypothetical protein ACU4GG_08645 [Streptomyces nojiriensis]
MTVPSWSGPIFGHPLGVRVAGVARVRRIEGLDRAAQPLEARRPVCLVWIGDPDLDVVGEGQVAPEGVAVMATRTVCGHWCPSDSIDHHSFHCASLLALPVYGAQAAPRAQSNPNRIRCHPAAIFSPSVFAPSVTASR